MFKSQNKGRVSMRSFILILTVMLCITQFNTEGNFGVAALGKKGKKTVKSTKKADEEISIEKLGQQKLQEMEKLEAKSRENIIEFNPSSYMKYVIQNPRPYDVVMIFNVKQNCHHCDVVQTEYAQTVYSFVQERGINKNFEKEKKIFFGVLYFDQATAVQEIFSGHDFNTVPYFAVSSMDMKRAPKLDSFYPEEDKWLISSNEVYDARMQITFVNNHLSTDVQIKYTFSTIVFNNILGMIILAGFATLVKQMYGILLNQWTWLLVSYIFYFVCTAGLVFSILNGMPIFRFERNEFGSVVITEYFQKGQRGQWAGEGFIMSAGGIIIGCSYLFMNNVEQFFQDKYTIRVTIYSLVAFIWIAQQMYLAAYRIKSPWYNPGFAPPDYYQKGPLMSDQGNNI